MKSYCGVEKSDSCPQAISHLEWMHLLFDLALCAVPEKKKREKNRIEKNMSTLPRVERGCLGIHLFSGGIQRSLCCGEKMPEQQKLRHAKGMGAVRTAVNWNRHDK